MNSKYSGFSSTTKSTYTSAVSNKKSSLYNIQAGSSEKQRQTKSITAESKSSLYGAKTSSSSNTWQKTSTQTSKSQPTWNNGPKSSVQTSKTGSHWNTDQKYSTKSSTVFHPNITGLEKSPSTFKTNSTSYSAETNSFKNTFKTYPKANAVPKSTPQTFTEHPNLYALNDNSRPAFRTHSNWVTPRVCSPAFKVHPNKVNKFALSTTPVNYLLVPLESASDRDRQQTKDDPSKGLAQRSRSPGPSQSSEGGSTTRTQSPPTSLSSSTSSTSRSHHNAHEDEFNCPTCKSTFLPQIYQCANGHSSCSSCKKIGSHCGICGQLITDMRNFALEEYLARKEVLCPHNTEGCKLFIKMSEMDDHVQECPYRRLECPAGCSQKVLSKQLPGHFKVQHTEQCLTSVGSEFNLRYAYEPSQKIYLVEVDAYDFLVHEWVSLQDGRVYLAAQLIGTKVCASKWFYEVHIYTKNDSRRMYTYSEMCTSFVEPVVNVIKEGKCCMLTQNQAISFLKNGVISYKVFIKKFTESDPEINLIEL